MPDRCGWSLLYLFGLVATLALPAAGQAALDSSSPVFDPRLSGGEVILSSSLASGGSYAAHVQVLDASGQVVRTLVNTLTRTSGVQYDDRWLGHDDHGLFVPPGAYQARFQAVQGGLVHNAVADVQVVRVGFTSIDFLRQPVRGTRVLMAYHRPSPGLAGSPFWLDSAGPAWTAPESDLGPDCLDWGDGSPLWNPAPWTNLAVPPLATHGGVLRRGRSLPVAYTLGARPRIQVVLGQESGYQQQAVECGYPLAGRPLRLVLGNAASAPLQPGDAPVFDLAPLPYTLGRTDLQLVFRLELSTPSGWQPVPGELRTEHRVYTVFDIPTNLGPAWVAAVDRVASWAAGAGTPRQVADAIIGGLNGGMGLYYDTAWGAPAYTTQTWALHQPEVDLGAFLDALSLGRQVNCLDCAGVSSSLAMQVGVAMDTVVLGWNFRLNWLKGIGSYYFVNDLFGGNHAFSYHAVASLDAGQTIHDACVRLDMDPWPSYPPFQEVLPLGVPSSIYLNQLSLDRHTGIRQVGRATWY